MKIYSVLIVALLLISCKQQKTKDEIADTTQSSVNDYNPEANLSKLKIKLSEPSSPVANYVNVVQTGNLLFLAGKGPLQTNGENITGKVGSDLTIEQGYDAARVTAINQLSVLKAKLGNLNKVKRIVKV